MTEEVHVVDGDIRTITKNDVVALEWIQYRDARHPRVRHSLEKDRSGVFPGVRAGQRRVTEYAAALDGDVRYRSVACVGPDVAVEIGATSNVHRLPVAQAKTA